MSHVRLRECSDCDASLTLNEVKREWTFRSFSKATGEAFTPSPPSEESHIS